MNPRDRKLRLQKTTLRGLNVELASNIRGAGSFIICPKLETGETCDGGCGTATCDTCDTCSPSNCGDTCHWGCPTFSYLPRVCP